MLRPPQTKEDVNFVLLAVGLLCLVFGWPISQLADAKIQYVIFAVIACLIGILNLAKPRSRWMYLYVVSYLVVAGYHLVNGADVQPIMIASIYYLAIPVLFGQRLVSALSYGKLMWLVALAAVPNALAVMLQMLGYTDGVLGVDTTITAEVVHDRYTGFMGGSLMLAQVSALGAVAAAHRGWVMNRVPLSSWVIFASAVFCVAASFSRLAYVVLAVGVAILLVYRREPSLGPRLLGGKRFAIAAAVAVFAIGGAAISVSEESLLQLADRIVSIGDFEEDEGNVLRAVAWARTLNLASEHPGFGIGPGSLGSVGQERGISADVADVAESYYLKVIAETGFPLGAGFLVLVLASMAYFVRFFRRDSIMILPVAHFAQISISAITLQLLEAPFFSVTFWMAFGIAMAEPRVWYTSRRRVETSRQVGLPSNAAGREVW